jgi:hypothetical protein
MSMKDEAVDEECLEAIEQAFLPWPPHQPILALAPQSILAWSARDMIFITRPRPQRTIPPLEPWPAHGCGRIADDKKSPVLKLRR